MDGNGREGTYNFFSQRLGQPEAGHRAQGAAPPATPLAPPMLVTALNCSKTYRESCENVESTDTVQTSLQSWTLVK